MRINRPNLERFRKGVKVRKAGRFRLKLVNPETLKSLSSTNRFFDKHVLQIR